MKGNKGVSLVGVVITILVIMLILSVGVCVYLIQNPVKEKTEIQNSVQSNFSSIGEKDSDNLLQVQNEKTTSSEENNEVEPKNNTTSATMTSDEKFSIYIKNLKEEMLKRVTYTIEGKTYQSSISENVTFADYETDGSLSEMKTYKIALSVDGKLGIDDKLVDENVITFKVIQMGTNQLHYLVYVQDNGTIGYTRIATLKTMKKDSKHMVATDNSNIIGILGAIDTNHIGLIDIDGKIVKITANI